MIKKIFLHISNGFLYTRKEFSLSFMPNILVHTVGNGLEISGCSARSETILLFSTNSIYYQFLMVLKEDFKPGA